MSPTRLPVLACCLIAVLLVGAVAPCGLAEVLGASLCATEDVAAGEPAEDASPAEDVFHPDCSAGCLSCCARYTETPPASSLAESGPVATRLAPPEQGRRRTAFSIWRPPRT